MENMKVCAKCKQALNKDKFNKNKSREDGLQERCKDCLKQWRIDNKEKIKAYRLLNLEHISSVRKAYYREVERTSPEKIENNRIKATEYYYTKKRCLKGQRTGDRHHNWKGGKLKDVNGYIRVRMPNHPMCDHHGYVLEHRLVMEASMGRFLLEEEIVHHADGNKNNNNISNLILFSNHKLHLIHCHKQSRSKENGRFLPTMRGELCQY